MPAEAKAMPRSFWVRRLQHLRILANKRQLQRRCAEERLQIMRARVRLAQTREFMAREEFQDTAAAHPAAASQEAIIYNRVPQLD